MSQNLTFPQVAEQLPFADFVRLAEQLKDAKVYRRKITQVVRKRRGEGSGEVGLVRWEPVTAENMRYEDPGEIATDWLTSPIACLVCQLAKEFTGHYCLVYQVNKHQSSENERGFRELIWLQVLEG